MSNLIDHARRELELCGQFDEDPAFAVSVLSAVSAFAAYPGHSGGSAMAGIQMLQELLQFKNLTPLTNNPDEWMRHTPQYWDGQNHVWQNKRNGSAFSEDGGLTYHLVDEDKRPEPYRTRITHTMEGLPIEGRFMDGQSEETVHLAAEPVNQSSDVAEGN